MDALGIDPESYLWNGSPCAFPGVRRHAGAEEISAFRNRSAPDIRTAQCLALDDHDYTKHLWAFALTGRPFRKRGPEGYQLAHLFDHKEHGNRWNEELDVEAGGDTPGPLFGLFTSAASTAYLPAAFLRPTDFSHALRTLLQRRAVSLYSDVCRPIPPPLRIKACEDPMWSLDRFLWNDPVGNPGQATAFLDFRHERMEELLGQQLHQVNDEALALQPLLALAGFVIALPAIRGWSFARNRSTRIFVRDPSMALLATPTSSSMSA